MLALAFTRAAALSARRNPCASGSSGAAAFLPAACWRGSGTAFGASGGSLFPEGSSKHFEKRCHLGDAADYLLHFSHRRDDAVYAAHAVDDAFDIIQAVAEIEAAFSWFGSFRESLIGKD